MDRYDRVIRDILAKTDEDILAWRVVNPELFDRLLLNPDRVRRASRAEYRLGNHQYELCFAETKQQVADVEEYSEAVSPQLLVIDGDGELVLSLYDGVVERDDLYRLAGLIAERNDRATNFFAAFDHSSAG